MARKTDSSDEKLDPSLIHKKKARRRLVGAVAFLGVVGVSLPFLLDPEPKVGTQEVQIHVPARDPLPGAEPVSPQAKARTDPVAPVVPVVPLEPAPGGKDAPKAESSKSEGAKPEMVKPDAAKPDVAKSDVAKSDAVKPDASKGDAAKMEASKAEAAKKDSAKKDVPKKDVPKKDEQKKDEQKKDEQKKDESKKDAAKKDAAKKPDERKSYSVQIGAFSSEDSANEQSDRAGKLGLKVYTEKISTNGGQRIRVRVGPFSSREQAEQALAKLKLNGVEAALVAP